MDKAFTDLVAATQRFLLSGHERPDGDCLGSQVGMYHLLQALGKDVTIVNPDPLNPTFGFLADHTPIAGFDRRGPLPEFDVAVLMDCAHLSRLASLGDRLRDDRARVAVIDHHVGSEAGDGEAFLVDVTAPSTGALVYELYRHYDQPIPRAAAEGIFLSLVADTGWFRYSNTDERALGIAAELVGSGVRPADLYDRMYRQADPRSVVLTQSVLATHRFGLDGKYLSACIDKATMAEASRIDFDTDAVLEPLRAVGGVEVVALFKERYDGGVKLSLRASGEVDVAAVARSFGGGGHVKAAGATLDQPLEEAVQSVEARVGQALASLEAGA